MSEELFEELDLDGSGEINRTELLNALQILGHTDADETTAIRIMDLIDLDRSGGIDKHEFVAWMVRSARV
jgi:Ca2+-binding EF-hand superfamily protein